MWFRDKHHKYLYNLSWNAEGYDFVLTDLCNAYGEHLPAHKIEARGDELNNPLALSTSHQISAFLAVIEDSLKKSEGIEFEEMKLKVNAAVSDVKIQWVFMLTKFDQEKTKQVYGTLINDLFAVVGNLGGIVRSRDALIAEKNMVITGIDEAMLRRVDYQPPRHLKNAFANREIPRAQPGSDQNNDVTDIVAKYLPEKVLPIVSEHDLASKIERCTARKRAFNDVKVEENLNANSGLHEQQGDEPVSKGAADETEEETESEVNDSDITRESFEMSDDSTQ